MPFLCLSEAEAEAAPVCLSVAVDEAAHPHPAHQHTCRAGAGFPTPALPDKRAQRHSMQDTQPETSVPSNAI